MLVTDINSNDKKDDKNLKFMIFCSFFTLTLSSVCSLISINEGSFYYGSTIIVIFIIPVILCEIDIKDDICQL